jgi:hypothetical protein
MGADARAGHPVRRARRRIRSRHELDEVPCVLAERQGAMPGRRQHGSVGLARHYRVPRRAPCGRLAAGSRSACLGAMRCRRDAFRVRCPAQHLRDELRTAGEAARDHASTATRPRSHRRVVVGGTRAVWRPVPRRRRVLRRRCFLCSCGVPRADLRPRIEYARRSVCGTNACAAVDARLESRRTRLRAPQSPR